MENYGKLPLSFEPNQGQTAAPVKFLSRGSGYTLFLTADEAVLSLRAPDGDALHSAPKHSSGAPSETVRMKLVGANSSPEVTGLDPLPGTSNYFLGSDPGNWRTNIPNFSRVQYHKTYPGVDLVYYGNPQQLEYDFVVAPGADPSVITLDIAARDTAENPGDRVAPLRIADNGDLLVAAKDREIRFKKPVVYQEENAGGAKHFINARWVMKDSSRVGFSIGTYDARRPLIIDPAVLYCTYLGGSMDNSAYNIVADAAGNAYVTGNSTSTDFPTVNPLQSVNKGGADAFIAKINPTGTGLVYSTYIGGTGQDYAFWITLDSLSQAHVVGSTSSPDFPTTAGAYQTKCGGGCLGGTRNSWAAVLNATGSALVYSTYIGGTGQDQANAVMLDSASNAYIAGWTTSKDFPTTAGAFQTTYSGSSDAFLLKLNPTGSALIYSTLLGTSGDNRAFGVQLDKNLNAYITGFTTSTGFPTTTGAFQNALKGTSNSFVTEINPTGSALVFSTYLGGNGNDIGWAIAIDSSNNTYIAGQTTSSNFPTTPGAMRTTCSTSCSANDAFVTKVNPTGTALVYSSYLGGTAGEQEAYALTATASGAAYVTGRTKSTHFPVTHGAFSTTNQGVYDAYIAQVNQTGSGLTYGTYIGGGLTDTALGIALDPKSNIYLAGRTFSTNLPVTPGAIQPSFIGTTQAFVVKFVVGDQVWPLALNYGTLTDGTTSAPQTATLTNSASTTLTISSIGLTGTNASDFAIASNTCGATLAGGASCTVGVTFNPTTVGPLSASLAFTDGQRNSPQTVALSGTGTSAALTLTPTNLIFGTQLVDTASPTQPVTLTNVSNGTVNVTGITASAQYSQTNNCPSSLASNANCTINVAFQPTAPGTQAGTLTVTNNLTGPATTTLTGVGTVMSFTPSSLNFGNQAKGTSSAPQSVTVKNVGTGNVAITRINITGGHVSSYSQTNNCPVSPSTLAAGATCTVNVVFTPTLKGALPANLSFQDSGGGSPQNVPLTGTGT